MTSALDQDWQIRLAAIACVTSIAEKSDGLILRNQLDAGFEFGGEKIRLAAPQRGPGIWKPRQLSVLGLPLSILTTAPRRGVEPRYVDQAASDDGWFEYSYQDSGPMGADNVALRKAMELGRPLIYFLGVEPGRFLAMCPIYVIGDDRSSEMFRVSVDTTGLSDLYLMNGGGPEALKAYRTRMAKERLHRFRFRQLVMGAYRKRCTICQLGYDALLDAAHIIPDRDVRGHPVVSNGLALCKIHHGAYDAGILGITPDYRVQIKEAVLEEVDGPMLRYGLQATHGQLIHTPRSQDDKPNPDYLAERYAAFRAA
jgi:putative restriction endonuclease